MKSRIETRLMYQRWPIVIEISEGGVAVVQKGRKGQTKNPAQFLSWDMIAKRVFPGAVEARGQEASNG